MSRWVPGGFLLFIGLRSVSPRYERNANQTGNYDFADLGVLSHRSGAINQYFAANTPIPPLKPN
jgi:hypothetical protein